MEIGNNDLKHVVGGAFSVSMISYVVRGITVISDLGRALGSAIRRIGSGNICPL